MHAAEPGTASERNNGAILLPLLISIIPAMITGLVSYMVARVQAESSLASVKAQTNETKDKLDSADKRIEDLVLSLNDFKRLRDVRGEFTRPVGNATFSSEEVPCGGRVRNLQEFYLWVAVEVDGYIYFKGPKATVNREDGTWTAPIVQPADPGGSKDFNLRLYAATEEGDYQIQNWLDIGANTGKYEKISTMSNTIRLDHADNLHIRLPRK